MDELVWPDAAWGRLRRWHERRSEGDDAALDALSDIGVLRRQLDGSELTAVRAARSRGRSWAEIATRLGVTRQSAWERWRDLDEETSRRATAPAVLDLGDDLALNLMDGPEGRSSRRARRGAVAVPDVVGLEWATARQVLDAAGLVAVSAESGGTPRASVRRSGEVVTDQKPAAGERVAAGSTVTLWFGRGPGDAGVREPLHPRPSPRSTGGAIDEETGRPVP